MSDSENDPHGGDGEFTARAAEEMRQRLTAPEGHGERPTPPHGIHIDSMRLYRGSTAQGIDVFPLAEEDTIGRGVYLTSSSKAAASYAEIRADEDGGIPVLYEADINDLMFVDLTKEENIAPVLNGFKSYLEDRLAQEPDLPYYTRGALRNAIQTIIQGKVQVGMLKSAVQACGGSFSDYLAAQGFDGVIGIEGGERRAQVNENTGVHDSYVIFDPSRVHVQAEHELNVRPEG